MSEFKIVSTETAGNVSFPLTYGTFTPTYAPDTSPSLVQLSNFNTLSAFYTQVGNIVSVNIRFTVDVSAPLGESIGYIAITPPVRHVMSADDVVGAVTTISQVGLFGNISGQGDSILCSLINAAGTLSISGAQMQLLGSYVISN